METEGLEKVNYLTGNGISNNWLNICVLFCSQRTVFLLKESKQHWMRWRGDVVVYYPEL